MPYKSLAAAVQENPFPDYQSWWPVGAQFTSFMANAMQQTWQQLPQNSGDLAPVAAYTELYLSTVFAATMRPNLISQFAANHLTQPLQSGEFDAISYAYYRHAFDLIAAQTAHHAQPLVTARRLFTRRVGRLFFDQLATALALDLPGRLAKTADFTRLQQAIAQVGSFLMREGYLRDHFAFHFEVNARHGGQQIVQSSADFLTQLQQSGVGYALYEMGYPIILPSAVYLYHTVGEAQHHSSRTIEELFARVGTVARETDDFDPINFPAELVVELWQIRQTDADNI